MDGERIESDSHESTLSITIVTKIGQRSASDQLQILKQNPPRQGRRSRGGQLGRLFLPSPIDFG
jgi:hypothetical protein